jgi:membrane protein DedA with SNARE-associated domain
MASRPGGNLNAIAQLLPDFVKRDPLLFFFAFLFLFAFTLPICEEIAVALVGVSAKALGVGFAPVAAISLVALLIQDLALFVAARLLGPRLMRRKLLSKIFKPDRIAAAERYFLRRGPTIILGSRFVVGLRISAILGSGFLGMRWSKFLLFDGLAAAIMTPAWLFVGYALGSQFDRSAGIITKVLTIIGLVAVVAAAFLVYRGVKADAARDAAAPGGDGVKE